MILIWTFPCIGRYDIMVDHTIRRVFSVSHESVNENLQELYADVCLDCFPHYRQQCRAMHYHTVSSTVDSVQ